MVEFKDGHPISPSMIPDGRYLDVKEFSRKYDVSLVTIRQWRRRSQIPSVSYYGKIFIPENCYSVLLKKAEKKL